MIEIVDTIKNVVVIVDSIKNNPTFPETLKVNMLQGGKEWFEYPIIIAVITVLGTLIGVWIGQRLQRRTLKEIYSEQGYLNRDKELFVMRMNGCVQIAEAMSELYHVTIYKKDGPNTKILPTAYITYQNLKNWNTNSTKLVDRKLLLLNQDIYSKFTDVNHMVLKHLDEIEQSQKPNHQWDLECRNIGRRECGIIQATQAIVVNSIREYIKSKYNINLEKVG